MKKINKGYYHEAADRLWMTQEFIEVFLIEHIAFKEKKYRKALRKIQSKLGALYQIMGAKM